MITDLEFGMELLRRHAESGKIGGHIDSCRITPDEAEAVLDEFEKRSSTHLHKLVKELLDEAISYGEYILTKEDMEALATVTGYELPKD